MFNKILIRAGADILLIPRISRVKPWNKVNVF